jgi:hypothetical protein
VTFAEVLTAREDPYFLGASGTSRISDVSRTFESPFSFLTFTSASSSELCESSEELSGNFWETLRSFETFEAVGGLEAFESFEARESGEGCKG